MNKYVYMVMMMAISVITFASCTNDAIEISRGLSVRVNPSGVILPFTYEVKKGELSSFSTENKLRIRLLAYNEKGKLVAADTTFLTNYEGLMNSSLQLAKGVYTLVAITDVVEHSSSTTFEYWTLSDEKELSQMQLKDAGYVGLENKILGIANKTITVSGDENTITLNPKPAGALLLIEYLDIHQFTDVVEYKLQTNRSSDYIKFNTEGDYVTVPENNNNQFDWRISFFNPQDDIWTDNDAYSYCFMFPVNNVTFRFVYSTATETDVVLATNMTVSLNAGDEYAFILDLKDENNDNNITYDYGKVNGNGKSAKSVSVMNKQSSIKMKEISKGMRQSVRVLDLLAK